MSLANVRLRAMAVVVLVGTGVTVGILLINGAGTAAGGGAAGISSISGMSEVISGSIPWCADVKGTSLPEYCSLPGATGGLEQGWVQTAAISAYGTLNDGLSLPIPLAFAEQHSGPAEVFVEVVTLATRDEANRLLSDPDYIGSWDPNYTALPKDAINDGVAFKIDSPANDGLTEFRFAWVGDSSVVEVNVLGANLNASDAQAVARLATPA